MIEKAVQKFELGDREPDSQTMRYWLSRPPAERFAEVDSLRRMFYGELGPMARVVQKLEHPNR